MNIFDVACALVAGLMLGIPSLVALSTYYPPWVRSTFNTSIRRGILTFPSAVQDLFLTALLPHEKTSSIKELNKFNYILVTVLRYVKAIGTTGIYPGGVEAIYDGTIIVYYIVGLSVTNCDKTTDTCTIKLAVKWRETNVIKKDIVHDWKVVEVIGGEDIISGSFYNWWGEKRQDIMSDNTGGLLSDIVGQIFPRSRFTISDGCDV